MDLAFWDLAAQARGIPLHAIAGLGGCWLR